MVHKFASTAAFAATYKVFPYDVTEAGSYNLIFNNCNNGSQAADFAVSEARDYYLTVTATGAIEKVATAIDTVIPTTVVTKQIRNGQIIKKGSYKFSARFL